MPYWREALLIWFGAILVLAAIEAVLYWTGRDKPGQFARFLGTFPTLAVMGIPPFAATVLGAHLIRDHREAEALGLFLVLPLFGVFFASKLRQLMVWILTGMGSARNAAHEAVPTASLSTGITLNGRPIDKQ